MPGDVLVRLEPVGADEAAAGVGPRRGRGRGARRRPRRPRRGARAPPGRARRGPPRRRRQAARPRPAHGPGERRRPRRRGLVRRVRPDRDRRPAPSPRARRPDRQHARRRARRRHRHRERRALRAASARGPSPCPTTTPSSPARRACRTTARRTACSSSPSSCSCPIVFFTEGGGGRPGDTDGIGASGLETMAFLYFAELSGLVPLVGVNAGYCFAGNAAILGCCDVVIATEDSNIGMGGPAMIEGGGLGVYEPTSIGPIEVQRANGVVDIVVADEAEGVAVAKQYLSYFQGRTTEWSVRRPAAAARRDPGRPPAQLRRPHASIELLFDTGSVLELRRDFGLGMITALARIEGRPGRRDRQQPDPPRRRHRHPRRRQGGAVHAAVRRVRPADHHAVRHARDDGRAGCRGDRARAPLQPAVRDRRQRHRADGDDRAAQGVRARRPGDDGRHDQGAAGVPGVADRRVRRHGPRGRRPARATRRSSPPSRTRRPARSCSSSSSGGCTRSARRSAWRRCSRSTTSSTRPSRAAGSAPCSTPPARPAAAPRQEAAERRHLVILAASAAALTGVALVVALAATVQLAAGFGFGLAAVPLLAVAIDPHDAVVVALTLATITNGYQAMHRATRRRPPGRRAAPGRRRRRPAPRSARVPARRRAGPRRGHRRSPCSSPSS